MEAALVGVGTGVMKPLLSKLSNLLEKEYELKGVRRDLESTRAEMCSMKAALEALEEAEQLDPEMTAWRDEVRELSFDMEDSVDDFMARADTKQDMRNGSYGFFDKLKKLKPRHKIAGEIKELKAWAVEASERHKRYKLDRSTPGSTTCDIDPRLHALYVEVDKLVGIEGPKKHIIDWFKNEGSFTQLRSVSIVGPGGLGKTTLGNAVFQTIKEEFPCTAFVSVSRKPNMKILLKDIARRVGMAEDPSNDDEQWLIISLREHLKDKKYLIMIDDLWSAKAWRTIKYVCPNNEHGSRIISTTRNSAVASFCSTEDDYVYRMEPLSPADSRRLFLRRAFCSEVCPPHLKEVSERILGKCAGLPLAIITMSSLLADQTAEEVWNKALAAVGSSLAKEDGAGDMTKILSLSYFDLPHYMRACLLYLSAFPEDYIIDKKSLIHKWMAEGFICEVEGKSTYEVGEGYFNDFINRSLIQPAELSHFEQYGEVMACRVHDIILDFITCKAKEENFMTSFSDAEHRGMHKVRRLSVMSRDNGMATVSRDLSHVRSLAVLGHSWQNCVLDFPVLRVLDLDIERCSDLENDHLANIEKLLLLKYLRLRTSYSITEIPEGIGKLKYLETLDMRGFRIIKLPSTMTQLQRLARLYATFEPACLSDGIIGQLQSLEELEDVHVSETELDKFLQELGQLTKLRTLSVHVVRSTFREKVDNVWFLGTLISSYNLHHLTIKYDTGYARECLLSMESWCLVNPVALRKICIDVYSIHKVPNWMISQENLCVLHLSEIYCMGPEDIAILGGIPALVALKMKTWFGRNRKIFFRTGFRRLKYFSLDICCCGTAVEFEDGSMPKLEHLELKFQAHKEECVNYAFDFGIQHLSALTKLDLCVFGDNDIIHKLIETSLGKFRHRPTLSLKSEASRVCSHFETALEQEWEEQKDRQKEIGERGGPCSVLGLLLEEIKQDVPRMRLLSTVPRTIPLDFLRNQFSEGRIIGTVNEGTTPDGQSISVKDIEKRPSIENIVERLDGVELALPSVEKKLHSSEVCAGGARLSSSSRMANQFNQGESSSSTRTKNYSLATEPMLMTFQELHRMTDGFSEDRLLGAGGYGSVYKGLLDNGEMIAVKKLHSNPNLVEVSFKNELLSLMRSQHPNIIRLLGYCSETREKVVKHEGKHVLAGEQERVLCLEYMQGGNLHDHLSDESCGLDWEARYKIIKGVCHGLEHLHTGYKNPIYHLDLKPENILLDKDQTPKIGDFGLSRLLDSAQTIVTETFSGTRGYLPPEYINGQEISPKFDVYSLGVIIIQIIAGRQGYYKSADMTSKDFIELVTENWRQRVQETNMSSGELLQVQKCIEIGLRCVEFKRFNRPTITQIVEELNMIS